MKISGTLIFDDEDFSLIKKIIYDKSGINLVDSKKAMVAGRLLKRLRELEISSYTEYISYLRSPAGRKELQFLINAISTNETFFFREPKHFEILKEILIPEILKRKRKVDVWSAACSNGAEVYSIAMTLQEMQSEKSFQYTLTGTDINSELVDFSSRGVYPLFDAEKIPADFLKKFCLKGVRKQEGFFKVDPSLKSKCRFKQLNLHSDLSSLGNFDIIFLRNVMIYFDKVTKNKLVDQLHGRLNAGGFLVIGHSESIQPPESLFVRRQQTVFQKAGGLS